MYLSSMELIGFKSFPAKTRIEFAAGITGVVGPNGCGKTNILDAIRWALGEQRISVLRGGKMEDVIFSGTREMKSLGMAEVSLTVVNDDNVLPTEYNNLTVTRRLHRSGESEYLLNNVPCRLKDITEMFADTGMGANAYSAIELDMVEAILSDKAEQRRQLFEEAAGISKYKIRKRAALRKLEGTEHDLLRLADILAEVSSQANSLHRQMTKAERFQSLEERIKNINLVLLKENCRQTTIDLRRVQDEKRNLEIKLAEAAGKIGKWELMREDVSGKAVELSVQLQQVRSDMEQCSARYHELNNEISVTGERIKAAETVNETDRQEIVNIKSKSERLSAEKEAAESERKNMQADLNSLEEQADAKEAEVAEKMTLLEKARKSTQEFQEDLFTVEGRKNLSEQSGKELARQIEEIEAELDGLKSRADELESTRRQTDAAVAANKEKETEISERIQRLQKELSHNEVAVAENDEQLDQLSAKLAQAQLEVNSLETHVTIQKGMIARYEGYGSGVGALLADDTRLVGIIDTVANLINAEERYLKPIELALGETAEYVVVTDHRAAERAIDYLKSNNLGRATFLMKDKVTTTAKAARPDGDVVRAIDVVRVDPQYRPIVELLLGDLLIAEDVDTARRLLSTETDTCHIVTLDGYYFPSPALRQGGSEEDATLLGRGIQLEKLQERLEAARAQLTRLRQEIESQRTARSDLLDQKKELQKQLDKTKTKQADQQLSATRDELQARQAQEALQRTEERLAAAQARFDEHIQRRDQALLDSGRLAGDTRGKRDALVGQREKVQQLEQETDAAARESENLRLKVIKLRTELESLSSSIARTDTLLQELSNEALRREEACRQRADEQVRLQEAIAAMREELDQQAEEKEKLREREMELISRQGDLTEKQSDYNELLKGARKDREQESVKHQERLVTETEVKAKYEDIRRQLQESHGIDIAELTLPEPLAPDTVTTLRAELEECRQKQNQMGVVNMLALEEYEREAKREQFLRRQIDDLTEAKDNLRTTINRINATARRMFLETFDQVRTNFKEVFAELFQGGEADIRLEDDADPLESPILISARPRGKRLLNISQLSGGEKALTAISLLFGIYLVKPSPFCILDEIDAPLDDANVGRFLKIVTAFSERTQFVVITHNKRTMEQCARLYGVTMEQPGVSQLVSVDFQKLGRQFVPETMTYEAPETNMVADNSPEPDVDSKPIDTKPEPAEVLVSDDRPDSEGA